MVTDPATKSEWLQSLREEPFKHDRWVFVPRIIAATLLGICLVVVIGKAYAEPILKAEANGVVITIYNEPCTHSEVANLPYRATWSQDGKVFDGCVGAFKSFGVAAFYFDDKTVAVVPLELFHKLVSV